MMQFNICTLSAPLNIFFGAERWRHFESSDCLSWDLQRKLSNGKIMTFQTHPSVWTCLDGCVFMGVLLALHLLFKGMYVCVCALIITE